MFPNIPSRLVAAPIPEAEVYAGRRAFVHHEEEASVKKDREMIRQITVCLDLCEGSGTDK